MNGRRLTRSRTDKMLGGVCGGLAAYLGISSTIVRAVFVVAFLFAGSGALLYLLLWLIMPAPSTT